MSDALALALACYRFPDADTPAERRMLRFDAAREVRALARGGSLPAPDVCPASGGHDGDPLVPQDPQGLARGVGRDVVDLGEVVSGGEPLTGAVLSAGDPSSQVGGDLEVGRGCRAMVDPDGIVPGPARRGPFTADPGGPWRGLAAPGGAS